VVGIGYRDGELLRSLLAEGSLTLALNVQTGLEQGEVENIVGILEGRERPEEILLLCAHRDSVPGSPGANDNASGMAVILEMMRAFSSQRLRRTLWGAFVGGGEGGSFGTRDLVESRRAELERIKAVINLDELGAGTVLRAVAAGESPPGRVWRTSEAVNRVMVGAAADLGYQLDDTFSGQMGGLADAQPFVEAGVPTAWISKGAGYAIKRYGHTPDDRPEKIEINSLKIPADILAVSLLRLDGEDV
jgi:aminopeptidase YwaD